MGRCGRREPVFAIFELIRDSTIKSVKFGSSRIIITHPEDFLSELSGGEGAP